LRCHRAEKTPQWEVCDRNPVSVAGAESEEEFSITLVIQNLS
jgi:hypothetical protein